MEHTYQIDGMTCDGCVRSVKSILEKVDGVSAIDIDLESSEATIEMNQHIDLETFQDALKSSGGKYQIHRTESKVDAGQPALAEDQSFLETYKPLLLIVAFLIGTSTLIQYPFEDFHWDIWMRHFMAGFFLVFAFFKLLNIKGFAASYSMYDIVAARWYGWGYIYPFIELSLGVCYLINFNDVITNWVTIVVLGVSSIGVIESNLNKRKIQCACLGDVFNLPMSTVTIVEDLSMVSMAAIMLIW